MSPIEERTNRTYILDEKGEEVIPEIVPEPYPSLPKPWPKAPDDDEPAKPEKED